MEIEVLMSGKEFVGFYRAKSPIGDAHLVNADQMAKLYETLEAKLAALVEAAIRLEDDWDADWPEPDSLVKFLESTELAQAKAAIDAAEDRAKTACK